MLARNKSLIETKWSVTLCLFEPALVAIPTTCHGGPVRCSKHDILNFFWNIDLGLFGDPIESYKDDTR